MELEAAYEALADYSLQEAPFYEAPLKVVPQSPQAYQTATSLAALSQNAPFSIALMAASSLMLAANAGGGGGKMLQLGSGVGGVPQLQQQQHQHQSSSSILVPSSGLMKSKKNFKKSVSFLPTFVQSFDGETQIQLKQEPLDDGPHIRNIQKVPSLSDLSDPEASLGYAWHYAAEPMTTACVGFPNGVCSWPKGRGLGGTSLLNWMAYTRGHHRDYDEWAQAGNTGWSYDDVLPFFKKGENSYVETFTNPYETPLVDRFTQSVIEHGYDTIDPNAKVQLGVYKTRLSVHDGQRCSAARAYLHPVRNRRNLQISMKSHVTKILINPETQQAYGVEFVKNGTLHRIKATKEVILSAGAIASPQLLMLSGIGPRDHLESLSIPVIKSLDVGHNLHDHMAFFSLIFGLNQSIYSEETNENLFKEYINDGTGPFSIMPLIETMAYVKTPNSDMPSDLPDIELALASAAVDYTELDASMQHLGLLKALQTDRDGKIQNVPKHFFNISPILMRPKSRGRLSLKSTNPLDHPRLEGNYFARSRDLDTLVEGIQIASQLGQSQHFASYGATLVQLPICDHERFGSNEYWKCVIQLLGSGIQHQAGTCKMGPDSDKSAVVSPTLQVHGVANLRVVDASIMPQPIIGHPMAVINMIGEKAAGMVKEYWETHNAL